VLQGFVLVVLAVVAFLVFVRVRPRATTRPRVTARPLPRQRVEVDVPA